MAKSAQPDRFATGPVNVDGINCYAEDGVDINQAINAKVFTDWLKSLDRKRFDVNWVLFQSLDAFGPRVGFLKWKTDLYDCQGKFLPGIVFARGGAVAVLAVLECEGDEHVILTVQPRVATGDFDFEEVCAGMLDGSGNFGGVAAKELHEELDIVLRPGELVNLSELSGQPGGVFMSPGACEETIRIFAFRRKVSRAEMDAINGKCTGELAEGEQITLKIVPLGKVLDLPDAKSVVAVTMYLRFKAQVLAAQAAVEAAEKTAASGTDNSDKPAA